MGGALRTFSASLRREPLARAFEQRQNCEPMPETLVRTSPGPFRKTAGWCFAVAGALALLAGCGHPATVEECNQIIAKSAELELRAQRVTDPQIIAERTKAVEAARGDELRKKCVGKRITDSALRCVAQSTNPKEFDKCLE